jgi:hypothetical protein
VYKIGCTFSVAVAVDRARATGVADRSLVKHLSLSEKNAFIRICREELKLEAPPLFDDSED